MKHFFILTLTFLAINAFGQSPTYRTKGLTINPSADTLLMVVYVKDVDKTQKPVAYYINDKFACQTLINTLNPNQIENLNVVKENVEIDKVQYYGKIYIKTKGNYAPKIISLTDLKDKHTNLKTNAIFMIDGNIINADYDKYLVDENYLLRIIVDKIENPKLNIDLNLIKLLTKSEDNLKKANQIMIRGTE